MSAVLDCPVFEEKSQRRGNPQHFDEADQFVGGAESALLKGSSASTTFEAQSKAFDRGMKASRSNMSLGAALISSLGVEAYAVTAGHLYGQPRNERDQINLKDWHAVHGFQNLVP